MEQPTKSAIPTTLSELDDEELVERLVEEVLEGHPRAEQWRQWREALEERLQKLLAMQAKGVAEFPDLGERIDELKRFLVVLREEEILTDFIEQQVRMVVSKAKLKQALGEDF